MAIVAGSVIVVWLFKPSVVVAAAVKIAAAGAVFNADDSCDGGCREVSPPPHNCL